MIDHLVGLGHLEQGASFVTLLPTNGPIRWFARALDPRRLFEPVARRGLAAVRTVQAEPAFKFRDPSLQGRNLRRLRRHQRYQLFSRRLTPRISIRIHRILESKADSAVEKKLPDQLSAKLCNLGSYAKSIYRSNYDYRGCYRQQHQ